MTQLKHFAFILATAALLIGAPTLGSAQEQPPAASPAVEAPPTFLASAETLHGTWEIDFEPMLASLPANEQEMARQMMGSMEMTLTITPEGGFTMNASMMGETQTETGTYEVVSTALDIVTVNMTTTETSMPSGPETTTIVFTFVDADNMVGVEDGLEHEPDARLFFTRQL